MTVTSCSTNLNFLNFHIIRLDFMKVNILHSVGNSINIFKSAKVPMYINFVQNVGLIDIHLS